MIIFSTISSLHVQVHIITYGIMLYLITHNYTHCVHTGRFNGLFVSTDRRFEGGVLFFKRGGVEWRRVVTEDAAIRFL